ncbi:hypothetical protein [Hyphococcus luteus]|uniref:Uncharacterized protein n=1 Tax=Hyphococcus luteus TaxID=2058213 RepID=A0A2S7K2Q6_9PROT|nr:hypothetical protein [Marinicaulis flavus]PQA86777.1 hypothetical protein CW354_14905 [Marinicaulis flavus]
MPENEEKPQDRQTAAQKKPGGQSKHETKPKGVKSAAKSADREARLAEALRANLRRRKAGGAGASNEDESADEKDR